MIDFTTVKEILKKKTKKRVSMDIDLVKASFQDIEYIANTRFDSLSACSYIFNIFVSYIEEYNKRSGLYFGPYTLIAQSSGFGKSKACEQLSKRGDTFIVYGCFR